MQSAQSRHRASRRPLALLSLIVACLVLATACSLRPVATTGEGEVALSGGTGAAAPAPRIAGKSLKIDEPAEFDLHFVNNARKVQALAGAKYEIRAMYTEAVVRSAADRADYHVGVMARPNSLTGYSLNVPPPGSAAPAGAPRLRYAQHPVTDDPLFPSLVDGTKMLNPTTSPSVYFLGQGILKTVHAAAFPPPLLDAFDPLVSSTAVGSVNDVGSLKLPASEAERLLNGLWMTGTSYEVGATSFPLVPSVVDRDLTDNFSVVKSRYYKWSFPFTATKFRFGSGLPLGRVVMDIRIIGASGQVLASGARQLLLEAGNNQLTFNVGLNEQGLVSLAGDLTDLSNRSRMVLFTTGSSLVPGDVITVNVRSDVPTPHVYIISVTVAPGDDLEDIAAKIALALQTATPSPIPGGGPGPYRIMAVDKMPTRFSDEFRILAEAGLLSLARVDGTPRVANLSMTVASTVPAATAQIAGGGESATEGKIVLGGEIVGGDWIQVSFQNGRGQSYEVVSETEPGDTLADAAERLAADLNGAVSTDESATPFEEQYEATVNGAAVILRATVVDPLLDAQGDGLQVSLLGPGVEVGEANVDPAAEGLGATLAQEFSNDARPGDTAILAFEANGQSYAASYTAAEAESPAEFAAGLAEAVSGAMADYSATVGGGRHLHLGRHRRPGVRFPRGYGHRHHPAGNPRDRRSRGADRRRQRARFQLRGGNPDSRDHRRRRAAARAARDGQLHQSAGGQVHGLLHPQARGHRRDRRRHAVRPGRRPGLGACG
ncbi:MAG: hypothetical protein FJZ01_25080 [Candidatus Sericytochromatia bacterium]|nr:hypothetical protein [Candidatus Tanganyikabacteria bacterium]